MALVLSISPHLRSNLANRRPIDINSLSSKVSIAFSNILRVFVTPKRLATFAI